MRPMAAFVAALTLVIVGSTATPAQAATVTTVTTAQLTPFRDPSPEADLLVRSNGVTVIRDSNPAGQRNYRVDRVCARSSGHAVAMRRSTSNFWVAYDQCWRAGSEDRPGVVYIRAVYDW